MPDRNPPTPSDTPEQSRSTDSAAASPVASDGATTRTVDRGPAPLTVLHVEPDPRSAELLAAFAAHVGGRVAVRSVGGAAAALAAVDGADCVVTEQRLPDGSGVELVERLKRTAGDLPVVFHTTCREERTEARAFGAGADAYFEKRPACGQYERILDRLRALVEERDPRRSEPAEPTSVAGSSALSETVRSEE